MEEKIFTVNVLGTEYQSFYIKDPESAEIAFKKLFEKDILFGVDTETMPLPQYRGYTKAGLSPHLSAIRLLQLFDGTTSFIFDMPFCFPVTPDYLIEFLSTKRFIAHNALFELKHFTKLGVPTMNIGCTRILSKLLFHATYASDAGLDARLDSLVEKILNVKLEKTLQTSDWGIMDLTFEQIEYAALDAIYVLKLAEKLARGIPKFGIEKIYTLCKAAQHPIASMELNGMKVHTERYGKMVEIWRDSLINSRKKILEMTKLDAITGHKMSAWLSQNLDPETLSIWPKTATGKLSTDAHTFADFSFLPIVEPFSAYQKQEKLLSTYGSALLNYINPNSNRIHCDYNICGTRTGRLSCSQPNLQQLPRSPTKEQKLAGEPDVRDCFIAEENNVFLCADYSQIELRVAAEVSGDAAMLKAYRDGVDLHALTASKILNTPLSEVTKSQRQMAKAFNFGLLFGLGASKFSHYAKKSYGVEISNEDALDAIQIFRDTYAGYTSWQREQSNSAKVSMEVRTPLGKLRRLDDENYYGGSMNTPIQGGAAECMLASLVFLDRELKNNGLKSKLVNCVHDEIIVESPLDEVTSVKELIKNSMKQGFLYVFPNGITNGLTEVGEGRSWAEAK